MSMTTTAQGVKTTTNVDIDGLIRRLNRVIIEIQGAQSANLSQTAQYDLDRIKSYTNMLRKYIAQIIAQPLLDFPETNPLTVELVTDPGLKNMENESLYDLTVILDLTRLELASSQSSRMASNLVSFDHKRLISYLDRMDNFITGFIAVTEPIDLPESSPSIAMVSAGLTGINPSAKA